MSGHPGIYRLSGTVQHYEWGGYTFIPGLLGLKNERNKPFAEYWMGSHPKSPSLVKLNDEQYPMDKMTKLPFLFKVLDVRDMLSIQVHPAKKAAEREFARENSERIPLDAPHRNYRDDNHKPELALAVDEFWLLHGFKNEEALRRILAAVPEFTRLMVTFNEEGYEGLYKKVMGIPQKEVNETLQSLLNRIIPLYQKGVFKKTEENFWAARAALTFNRGANIDRGIFSVYFFNIVHLQPGEAIFQDAGIPHAYLEGPCMEIMASSDNVLRGGLTAKHVDVKELMKHVLCKPLTPSILKGEMAGRYEKIFETPAPDFQLSELRIPAGEHCEVMSSSDEILFVYDGLAAINTAKGTLQVKRGDAVFVNQVTNYGISPVHKTVIYRAARPVHTT